MMRNMRVVMWDLTGAGMAWMDEHAVRIDLIELASIDGKQEGTIPISLLSETDEWDWLFIFEFGMRSYINRVLEIWGIPQEKVMYPFDSLSIVQNGRDSYYMFDEVIRRAVEFYDLHHHQKYSLVTLDEGISYIGKSTDLCIMSFMYMSGQNWALNDMQKFYELSKRYYSFTEKQTIFMDIGANIGTTCIYFKKQMDSFTKIVALEPMPETFWLLSQNIHLNGLQEEAKLLQVGVSDREEEKELHYDESNPGGSSLVWGADDSRVVPVKTDSFDGVIRKQGISLDEIKYLWIDVEGFEGAFVTGGKETLRQLNVPIVMEVTPKLQEVQGHRERFLQDLQELYSRYIVMGEEEIREYPIEQLAKFDSTDEHEFQKDIFLLK